MLRKNKLWTLNIRWGWHWLRRERTYYHATSPAQFRDFRHQPRVPSCRRKWTTKGKEGDADDLPIQPPSVTNTRSEGHGWRGKRSDDVEPFCVGWIKFTEFKLSLKWLKEFSKPTRSTHQPHHPKKVELLFKVQTIMNIEILSWMSCIVTAESDLKIYKSIFETYRLGKPGDPASIRVWTGGGKLDGDSCQKARQEATWQPIHHTLVTISANLPATFWPIGGVYLALSAGY